MKRSLLLIIGILLVLLLLGIWVYMLFFNDSPRNTPPPDFSDLDFPSTTSNTPITSEPTNDATSTPTVALEDDVPLQQLTTTPIIGMQEIATSSTASGTVWYIEPGTGHIYSINTVTGEEVRISGTTIPTSWQGSITPNGQYVMMLSGQGTARKTTVGLIDTATSSETDLVVSSVTDVVHDFTATADNTFLYLTPTTNGAQLREYYPETGASLLVASVPFTEVAVAWGETADAAHYLYPKANSWLEGFLYEVRGGVLTRVPAAGYGLTAYGTEAGVLVGHQDDSEYQSMLYFNDTNETVLTVVAFLPEKCTRDLDPNFLWCGSENSFSNQAPNDWYEGTRIHRDNLWKVDMGERSYTFAANPTVEVGRELDMYNLQIGNSGDLYFQNKNDGTLWLYNTDTLPEKNFLE